MSDSGPVCAFGECQNLARHIIRQWTKMFEYPLERALCLAHSGVVVDECKERNVRHIVRRLK